jgi:bacteriochlorophyllide a dehydrogenase
MPSPKEQPVMQTRAIVMERPEHILLRPLDLLPMQAGDVVVDLEWSGISTGTERLIWSGRMPPFPGFGYPLVPGYESVGRIAFAGAESGHVVGQRVFVPGSRGFRDARGLFGGAASRIVTAGDKVSVLDETLGESGILLALAATAHHALAAPGATLPELIIGHGVLGRLLARIAVALGGQPVVWEKNPARMAGAEGYLTLSPDEDTRKDYRAIYDVSGDAGLINALIARLAPGGELVLAGFYEAPISFDFPPAFMREARLRIAAEWKPADIAAVTQLLAEKRLSLAGLITHTEPAENAPNAYHTAFTDAGCLKMILDWRENP